MNTKKIICVIFFSLNEKPWIMISYSHDNNEFCSQLLALLNTYHENFEIWIDRMHCQAVADLWESIAEGMERALVILCLISSQYFESKSCRKEFIYATDSLKKLVVPVLLENFEPKGWLGRQSKRISVFSSPSFFFYIRYSYDWYEVYSHSRYYST